MTTQTRRVRFAPVAAGAIIATAGLLLAGPLDPPAGPVAPTYKTLAEVEARIAINATNTPGDADSVFKITQRGSYYLTGNLQVPVNRIGIEIASGGVDVDLNGFSITSFSTLPVVQVTLASQSNVVVRGGSINGAAGAGIDLDLVSNNAVVADAHVFGCGSLGIRVGDRGVVRACEVASCGGTGIATGFGSAVRDCVVSACSNGISASTGVTISNCSASDNDFDGIQAGAGATLWNCSAFNNAGDGFGVSIAGTMSNCSAYDNAVVGIRVGIGGTVSNCSAYSNSARGISTSSGCTVTDCIARDNALDGILVSSNCTVRGNMCSSSNGVGGGAGIRATGTDNRIEGNNCTGADRGIDVDVAGNIIIKNTCSGNGIDWVIAANNVVGPILDRRAPASAAINGFTAPDSTGSTHPNANFSY